LHKHKDDIHLSLVGGGVHRGESGDICVGKRVCGRHTDAPGDDAADGFRDVEHVGDGLGAQQLVGHLHTGESTVNPHSLITTRLMRVRALVSRPWGARLLGSCFRLKVCMSSKSALRGSGSTF